MQAYRPEGRPTSGFTLVEVIMTLAIAAIVLTTAAPSFSALLEKQRLDGAASRLASDIQLARTEAWLRGERIRISLHGASAGCYLLHTGSTAACTCADSGSSTCSGGAEVVKSVGLGTQTGIQLRGSVVSIQFDPLHGTSTPAGTFTLTATSGRSISQTVNLMGRIRTCSPSLAAPAVPGYAIC